MPNPTIEIRRGDPAGRPHPAPHRRFVHDPDRPNPGHPGAPIDAGFAAPIRQGRPGGSPPNPAHPSPIRCRSGPDKSKGIRARRSTPGSRPRSGGATRRVAPPQPRTPSPIRSRSGPAKSKGIRARRSTPGSRPRSVGATRRVAPPTPHTHRRFVHDPGRPIPRAIRAPRSTGGSGGRSDAGGRPGGSPLPNRVTKSRMRPRSHPTMPTRQSTDAVTRAPAAPRPARVVP